MNENVKNSEVVNKKVKKGLDLKKGEREGLCVMGGRGLIKQGVGNIQKEKTEIGTAHESESFRGGRGEVDRE